MRKPRPATLLVVFAVALSTMIIVTLRHLYNKEVIHQQVSSRTPVMYPDLFPMLNKVEYSPDGVPALLSNTTEQNMVAYDNMERDYERYILRNQFDCRKRDRAGKSEFEDGGWEVCLDRPFNMIPGKCLVYSFGINNEWSFDDYMDKKFGCTVHSFDPSMVIKNDYDRSINIHFHPIGIGGKNEIMEKKNWPLRTLGTLLRNYGHENKTLDYLKIDVESAEWPSLAAIYKEGVLSRVKQLGLEVHYMSLPNKKDLEILLKLHELGFRIFYAKRNYYSRLTSRITGRTINTCYEVHFVNINFIKTKQKIIK